MSSAFLAAQQECDAQIVYTNVEPDSLIGFGNTYESYSLDLNNDGVTDFLFVNDEEIYSSTSFTFPYNFNVFLSPGINKIAATPVSSGSFNIEVLMSGDTIDANQNWHNNNLLGPGWQGNYPINGFIGLEFIKNSQTHYGWARLYSPNGADYLVVKDFAYNTIANAPILAGETSCNTSVPPPSINWNGISLESIGNGTPQWFLNGDTLSGYNANNISPPLTGTFHVIYSDSLGCNSQSQIFYYISCDSVVSTIVASADTLCFGMSLTLEAFPANQYFYYQWQNNNLNYGDNSLGDFSLQTNILDSINNFSVIISYPEMGCADTSLTINVYEFPEIIPTITISGDTLISSTSQSYLWLNYQNLPVDSVQFFLPPSTGIYSVFVTNYFGCYGWSEIVYYDQCWYIPNTVQNLGDSIYCPGAPFNDSLLINYNSDYLYQWNMNGSPVTGADSNIFYAVLPGNYNVQITDTTSGCIVISNSIHLEYSISPIPFILQSIDTLFTYSGMNGYQWYLNSQPISWATNWFYLFNQPGNYSVETYNEINCSATSQEYFFSNCFIAIPQIQNSNGNLLCEGESTTLFLIASAGNNVQWFMNGDSIIGATTYSTVVYTSGNYSAIVSNGSFGCSAVSDTILIIVYQTTTPVITQNGDTLFSSVPFGNHWYYNSVELAGIAATHYFLIPSQNGTYYVANTDLNGCETISAPFIFSTTSIAPNVIEPYELIADGKEIIFKIKNINLMGGELTIYNVLSKEIYSTQIKNEIMRFKLNEASGMYFIMIENDRFLRIEKIILN